MRYLAPLLVFAAMATAGQAHAEVGAGGEPGAVTRLLLLDSYRGSGGSGTVMVSPHATRENAEPREESLADAVQRMWSQVRAYRRPGGAEFWVRGRF
ncbi:MAG: hypothetical protein R3B13_36180 [Polyangiaceae bacterium]